MSKICYSQSFNCICSNAADHIDLRLSRKLDGISFIIDVAMSLKSGVDLNCKI